MREEGVKQRETVVEEDGDGEAERSESEEEAQGEQRREKRHAVAEEM